MLTETVTQAAARCGQETKNLGILMRNSIQTSIQTSPKPGMKLLLYGLVIVQGA